MEWTHDTPEPIVLVVDQRTGTLEVVATDTTVTRVVADGNAAEQLQVRQEGGTVFVRQPSGLLGKTGWQLRVRVELPTRSNVRVQAASTDVRTTGLLGTVAVETGSGEVSLEAAEGGFEVRAGSGNVRLGRGDAHVRSGSGDVWIGEADVVACSVGSGDVSVDQARDIGVKSGSGDVRIGRAQGNTRLHSSSGDVSVEELWRGEVHVSTASGDVRLGIAAGVPVWVEVDTVTGDLQSDLAERGRPGEGQEYLALHLRTVSGDIVLREFSLR